MPFVGDVGVHREKLCESFSESSSRQKGHRKITGFSRDR